MRALSHPHYRYTPWTDERRMRASERAAGDYWRRMCTPRTPKESPPLNRWVLAFWEHMWAGYQRQGPGIEACGGWFPTRRTQRGWQAQFGSFKTYIRGGPRYWMPLLQPARAIKAKDAPQ